MCVWLCLCTRVCVLIVPHVCMSVCDIYVAFHKIVINATSEGAAAVVVVVSVA